VNPINLNWPMAKRKGDGPATEGIVMNPTSQPGSQTPCFLPSSPSPLLAKAAPLSALGGKTRRGHVGILSAKGGFAYKTKFYQGSSIQSRQPKKEVIRMGSKIDPKTMVSSNELLMSQVVSQEAIIRLLIEKGIFTKEEFLKMVEKVNLEMAKMV